MCAGPGRARDRALIIIQGEARLLELVKAHGQVVNVICVLWFKAKGLKIKLLRLIPA